MRATRGPFDWTGPLDEPVPLQAARPIATDEAEIAPVGPVVGTRKRVLPPSASPRWQMRTLLVAVGCVLAFGHGWTSGERSHSGSEIHSCGATHCPGSKGE